MSIISLFRIDDIFKKPLDKSLDLCCLCKPVFQKRKSSHTGANPDAGAKKERRAMKHKGECVI